MMRWCYLQTNEYDLQAKMQPIIWTYHELHNCNETGICLTKSKAIEKST